MTSAAGDAAPLDMAFDVERHLAARQGLRRPWRMYQNYPLDLLALKFSPLRDTPVR